MEDKDGKLLPKASAILARWVRFFVTPINARLDEIRSESNEGLKQMPTDATQEALTTMQEMNYALRATTNTKTVKPDNLHR